MALLSFPGYENSLIKPLLRHMVTSSLEILQFEYCVGHFDVAIETTNCFGGQILFQCLLIALQNSALVTKYNSTDPISRLTLDKEWPIYSKLALSTLMLTLT